ncbi:MAG: glycosyltransferase [Flaviaesturariibacter sp.]|nr:glycosyltransferase [Flaviaesturariibacter sp.]
MFTILNPHVSDFFGSPLSFKLLKRRALRKYGYLLDEHIAAGHKVDVLVNNAFSGLIPDSIFRKLPGAVRSQLLRAELKQWVEHNQLEGKVTVHFSPDTIPDKNILLFLCYRNYLNPAMLRETCRHFSVAIGHLTHYYATPGDYSRAIEGIPNLLLASDVDVTGNTFFRHFFPWYRKPMLVIPFAVYPRFQVVRRFDERKPKAVATGTFHMLELDASHNHLTDLKTYAGARTVHPVRREIYERKEELADTIDCYCFPYFETNVTKKKWYQRLLPKKLQVAQSSYFSFNIVDKYNEYKYVIVGEEYYNGIPGVGAFEAMACGCVLLGNRTCYAGTGMEDGVHYLGHDNSIEEINALISGGNADPARMLTISKNASALVHSRYAPQALYTQFVHLIQTLH